MRILYCCVIAAYAVILLLPRPACAQPLGPGDAFPDFSHANNLDIPECDYLGIDPAAGFQLDSLKQDIIILKFMNVFCDICRENVELYNELWEISLSHKDLGGTFAVLGIAVGNSFEEMMQFKDELFVQYPILLDSERKILELTGSVRGAPQTYLLQRQKDRYIIRHFSRGATDLNTYLALLRTHLDKQPGNESSSHGFSFCFMADGTKYTEKQFAGSRVLLYFPHQRTYSHAADTRNTSRQVDVLRRALEQYPDMRVIVIEQSNNTISTLKDLEWPPGFTRGTCDNCQLDRLAAKEGPTIYYINASGTAVFKGQALTLPALRSMMGHDRYRAEPAMSEADIISLITRTLAEKDPGVTGTEKTDIGGHAVYLSLTDNPVRFYYSRLESSPSLCDLCHDSHFIYSIDNRGRIVAFIPVDLPKWGNAQWTVEEVASFQTAFTGKNILETFTFNADVDAVSGATITSSIVYDGFNRGKDIFEQALQSATLHEKTSRKQQE